MTVKELLSRNHVTFTEIPEDLVNVPLRIFVDMWNKMDPDLKSKLESVAYICQRRIEQDERGSSPLQSTPNEPEATNDSPVEKPVRNWRAENGAKRKSPVVPDEELISKHIKQMSQRLNDWNHPILNWSLCQRYKGEEIIPRTRKAGKNDSWTSNVYKKLSEQLFQDGSSTLREILETVPEIIEGMDNLNLDKKSKKALSVWQDVIIDFMNKHSAEEVQEQIDAEKTQQKIQCEFDIREHACETLSLVEYVDMHLYNFDLTSPTDSRLLGCSTLGQVFDLTDSIIERKLAQPKRREDYKQLRDDIRKDVVNHCAQYDKISESIELPSNLPQEASLYEQIRTAIVQQCSYWKEKGEDRDAEIIEQYFLENLSANEIIEKQKNTKKRLTSDTQINNIVSAYLRIFKGGPEKPLGQTFIAQNIVEQIDAISQECLYRSSKEFWEKVAPEKSDERAADNIIKMFFKVDFATPSQKDDAQFWDTNTCICVRDADKGKFKEQVLKPIYQFLQTKIEPVDIEVIQGIIDGGHEVAMNTDYLKSVLKNYSKVIRGTEDEDTYQLAIDAYSKATYKCARYVYEHREENREFLQEELEDILHIGKTKLVPSNLDDTLKKIVTLKDGRWKYGSYNADVSYIPLRTLVFQFAEKQEKFELNELREYISNNYREQPSENTIYGYATRFCYVSSENDQLFCYNKAIDKHPEFKRKERKEKGTIINDILKQIHILLIEHKEGLKINAIRKSLIVEKGENKAYYISLVDDIINKFSSEETSPSNTPFLYREKGNDMLVVLNKNHEDFDWSTIGKSQTARYRDVVIDRAVQFLRRQKDYKCSRLDLYRECMPLFDTLNPRTAATIFYGIIYHHLDDTISSEWKEGDFYLWLNPEQIAQIASEVVVDEEIKEDNYTLPERKPYPYGTRPTPDRNNFKERLAQYVKYTNMKSGLNLNNEDIEKASQYLTEMLFENEDIQIYNDILCDWYEYLNYQIDLRSARSIYTSSLNAYEKYLRELYGIEPSYYNRIAGLADTIANIPDLCEEFGYEQIKRNYNRTPIQTFYNSFWLDRNNLDHGDNLRYDEKFVYKNIRQAIVLYVYAYLRREQLV